jgi:AraC family transcriptional regulator, regulatory protein of adaptative response / methylated-DNA-[protein]-cysteine methyltransferase
VSEARSQTPGGREMDDEARWGAVAARDAGADGHFVFAVRSTGIYCRPSCPARRPRRDRVVFFQAAEEAEREGYRPCRRCRPHESAPRQAHAEEVARACRYIEAHIDAPLTLGAVSRSTGLSPHPLRRAFQRVLGLTPRQYVEACRLNRVKERLREGDNVTTALYAAGYGSSSRLYERAPAHLGMTPATYRRGGRGMRIRYTIVDSPLGRLLVGATERGICAISLGASDAALVTAVRREYPAADVRRDATGLGRWVAPLLTYLAGRQPDLDLPVDVQATAFQRRVWEALRAIPSGSTRSYSQIARAVGHPTAARAVARACATNPAALVIPCHRVVREDGGLGGYRWGVGRKQRLLDLERRAARSGSPRALPAAAAGNGARNA